MDTSDKIIEILKQDKQANALMQCLNDAANKGKIPPGDYEKARGDIIMIAILNNPEAFKVLSDSVWIKLNKKN